MLYKLKHEILPKLIASVPPELENHFEQKHLNGNLHRIRIVFFSIFAGNLSLLPFVLHNPDITDALKRTILSFDLSFFSSGVISSFLIRYFSRKIKIPTLWLICYLALIFGILITLCIMLIAGVETLLIVFLQLIILILFIPDFKPALFIFLSILPYFLIVGILAYRGALSFTIDGIYLYIHIIFFIILITKIFLYNSKVKNFILTENLEKLVRIKTKSVVDLKNAIIETMAELVERRDKFTGGHVARTSKELSIFIESIIQNKISPEETVLWNIEQMVLSAQLHDVGKIAINDSILHKPDKLTADEFEIMKKHTVFGGEVIKNIQTKTYQEKEFLDYAYIFAVYHHEKWDGSGYPNGISGKNIPLLARIMAIIDVYDALISERPYKKAFTHEEAVKIIKNGSGSHFDPILTELFISVSDKLLNGG